MYAFWYIGNSWLSVRISNSIENVSLPNADQVTAM